MVPSRNSYREELGRKSMERITNKELSEAFKRIRNGDMRTYDEIILDAQLQADKQAVRASREKIADQLMDWFTKTQRGEFIGSYAAADQIIKILTEAGVTDGS